MNSTGEKTHISRRRIRRKAFDDPTRLICILLPNGSLKRVNETFCRYFGKKQNQLVGKSIFRLVPEADHPVLQHQLKDLASIRTPGGAVRAREHRVINCVGELCWQQWNDSPIFDRKGRVVEIRAEGRDITERKECEIKLRKCERLFDEIARHMPGAFWVRALNGFFYINSAFEAIWGRSGSDLYRRPELFWEYVHPDERNRVEASCADGWSGGSFSTEFRIFLEDGAIRWVRLLSFPAGNDPLDGRIEFASDITQLKIVEQELSDKTMELANVNTALEVLLRKKEEEKKNIEDSILCNVKSMLFPLMEKMKAGRLTEDQAACMAVIESCIDNLTSPFIKNLSQEIAQLTPAEIKVSGLVKDGRTIKEIAALLSLSEGTIRFHRENIRRKLGLTNKKTNLRSYLQSLT